MDTLYQEIIIKYGRKPLNFVDENSQFDNNWKIIHGKYPACTEKLKMWFYIKDNNIFDVKWTGKGSLILMSAGSIVTEYIKKKSIDEVKSWINVASVCFTNKHTPDINIGELGKLLSVKSFPRRLKSVTLPIYTVKMFLENT